MQRLQEIIPNLWTTDVSTSSLQVRSVVVIGEQHCAVWDTLTHPRDMSALTDQIGDKSFYVIYSHGDWDHIWGTDGFAQNPLDVVAHQECLRRFADDVPITLRRSQLAELGKWDAVSLVPPNITFTTRMSLDLGGVTLELHYLPGHTLDSIVGWIPESGVFIGGDAIETPLPVVNDARLLEQWLAALETWARKDKLIRSIPSHGSIDGRESLDQTVKYLRALTGDRQFELPSKLDDFYRETHQKNLMVADGGPSWHD